jgi:hypothetical protein
MLYKQEEIFEGACKNLKRGVLSMEERLPPCTFSLWLPNAIQFDLPKTELLHYTTEKGSLTESLTLPD